MADVEGLPIVPHLASEFYAWVWWASEQQGAVFQLGAPVGQVDVWVEDRLSFRRPDETKVAAVLTGENPAAALEARAALAGGKVVQDIRVGVRRDDREYFVTLKGPAVHLTAVKLPQVVVEGGEEVVLERVHLVQELELVLGGLYKAFAAVRTGKEWQDEVLPGLHDWILGRS